MNDKLRGAMLDPKWLGHTIGDVYSFTNINGKVETGWKIAYYPLFGTYKNEEFVEFEEPRALIEKPHKEHGTDFREMPLRYLEKSQTHVNS